MTCSDAYTCWSLSCSCSWRLSCCCCHWMEDAKRNQQKKFHVFLTWPAIHIVTNSDRLSLCHYGVESRCEAMPWKERIRSLVVTYLEYKGWSENLYWKPCFGQCINLNIYTLSSILWIKLEKVEIILFPCSHFLHKVNDQI